MLTMWKFPIAETDRQTISVPHGAVVHHAGFDPTGRLCLWAEVMDDAILVPMEVAIVGTGHRIPVGQGTRFNYIGTVNSGPFIWHIYVR